MGDEREYFTIVLQFVDGGIEFSDDGVGYLRLSMDAFCTIVMAVFPHLSKEHVERLEALFVPSAEDEWRKYLGDLG